MDWFFDCINLDQSIRITYVRTCDLLCSVIPESEPINGLAVVGFLSCCIDNIHQFLLVLLDLFFATNSPQFFNFLAISCMIFLEEPSSQFQFSIQADFISLSLIFSSTCCDERSAAV